MYRLFINDDLNTAQLDHAVKNLLCLLHFFGRESTQLYIHIVVRIVRYEFFVCSTALLGRLGNRILQRATENTEEAEILAIVNRGI